MNTHLNGRESLRISESEWLTSTISQFIDGICGISDQPLLLTVIIYSIFIVIQIFLRPTSQLQFPQRLPLSLTSGKLTNCVSTHSLCPNSRPFFLSVNGVADDFDELPLHQSTDDTSSINTDPTTFSPQAEGGTFS